MRRANELRDRLEQEVVTGALRPGEHLDEQSLAARFGVSRTPIREALIQLATSGLVILHPRRGAFVASLGLKEIIERFEVMAALEGACGALAARRITDDERGLLLEAHEACVREAPSGGADAYYYRNERFHHVIYDACHNAFLAEQARQLHARLKPYRRLQLRARSRVASSLKEHQGDRRCRAGGRRGHGRAALEGSHPDPGRAPVRFHRQLRGRGRGLKPVPA